MQNLHLPRGRSWLLCTACQHRWEVWVGVLEGDLKPGEPVECPQCQSLEVKRLFQMPQICWPDAMKDENFEWVKWHKREFEPRLDVIKSIHYFNYEEPLSDKEAKQIQKHKLVVW